LSLEKENIELLRTLSGTRNRWRGAQKRFVRTSFAKKKKKRWDFPRHASNRRSEGRGRPVLGKQRLGRIRTPGVACRATKIEKKKTLLQILQAQGKKNLNGHEYAENFGRDGIQKRSGREESFATHRCRFWRKGSSASSPAALAKKKERPALMRLGSEGGLKEEILT